MLTRLALPLALSLALAGCSGSSALTTGSLFGGNEKAAPAPAAPRNDPSSRAFQVGAVTARAQKCGFNFDAEKLRTSYLAAEAQLGTPVEEIAKAERLVGSARATVAKVIAPAEDYCSDERVAYIRGDLTRHLAGDFTPGRPKDFSKDDGGIFSFGGWGSDGARTGDQPIASHPSDNR